MADDGDDDDKAFDNGFVQGDDNELMSAVQGRESQTAGMLRTDASGALKIALQDPPYNTKNIEIKEKSAMVVCKALFAIKEADQEGALAQLNPEECDVRQAPSQKVGLG